MSASADSSDVFEMPMFPLGSVLFPGGLLPLHIFETRYQQLLNQALETDRRFGVVLISRGSEVGGGEIRTDIGTAAYIDKYQRFDDGRSAVASRGTTRFRVVQWLDDDPYPRAMVQELGQEPEGRNDRDLLRAARDTFMAVTDLGQRLGRLESAPKANWLTDIDDASWQLADRSPCTALDRYTILAARTRGERLGRIDELLQEVYADLELMGGM
jgi:Lon protease-like protein